MTVRLVSLGGTDWANGEIAYAADFNDTINRARSSIGSAIGTYTSGATVYTGSSSNYNRITMADTILFSGGATVGISGVAMFIARNSITINGQIIGTAFGGPGGAGGGGGGAGTAGGSGLISAGGDGGGNTNGGNFYNFVGTGSTGSFAGGFLNELKYTIMNPPLPYLYYENYNYFRGAGGGGGKHDAGTAVAGGGGAGGAGLILIAPTITISGIITLDGASGGNAVDGTGGAGGGGGGAGGCCFIFAKDQLNFVGGSFVARGFPGGDQDNGIGLGTGGAGGFLYYTYGAISGTPYIEVTPGSRAGVTVGVAGSSLGFNWRGV